MIAQWNSIDCAGGLRSSQPTGYALYKAAGVSHPERLVHAGAISTSRIRANARCGRRRLAALLLLAALVLGVLALSARPAAGAGTEAPRRPCPIGWAYRLTRRTVGSTIVYQHMCIREARR